MPITNDPAIIGDEPDPLVKIILHEIEQGQARGQQSFENEKKQTYWKIGQHIKNDILKHANRADYGKTRIVDLSAKLKIAKTLLYQSVQFHEEYPNIFRTSGKLTWSHYTILLSITDSDQRQAYEEKIETENLSVRDLRNQLGMPQKSITTKGHAILSVSRDEPYVFVTEKINGMTKIDLGFNFFIDKPVDATMPAPLPHPVHFGSVPHYTYKAYVLEVLDGDTLWVYIDQGYGAGTKQKLRLRGINSAEIQTSEGQTAKTYIETQLNTCKFIAVKTYWRDKFTRYLADIFYDENESDLFQIIKTGIFLNQELLDNGLAIKY